MDISINATDGVQAVPILREFFDRMPALRYLVICLKSLLSRHHLNTASGGGLSSYGLICLAINYLQINPQKLPNTHLEDPMQSSSLGIILVDLLDYYGNRFSYKTDVAHFQHTRQRRALDGFPGPTFFMGGHSFDSFNTVAYGSVNISSKMRLPYTFIHTNETHLSTVQA